MSVKDNLSAVLHGIKVLKMEHTAVPDINEDEVLLQMAQVGICGSDVKQYSKGKIGKLVVKSPMILGHEGSGIVVKCGQKVKHLKEGDRVAIEPGVPCRTCNYCKLGRYNLCRAMIFCSSPPNHGNLCRYFKQAEDFCYKLPDNVSLEEGALCEPLSVAIHACRRANVTVGSEVLVCGAGPIGLVSLLCAKAMGASKVCVTDVVDYRLQLAKEMGADEVINVSSGTPEVNAILVALKMGGEPDVTIECSGAEASIRFGIFATQPGGVLILVGLGPEEVNIPILNASFKEVDIRGVYRYANCYPTALSMIASGKVDVKPLITHRFKLEDAVEAFETAITGTGNPVKIMISCK